MPAEDNLLSEKWLDWKTCRNSYWMHWLIMWARGGVFLSVWEADACVCYANWRGFVHDLWTLTLIACAQLGLYPEWDLLCLCICLCVQGITVCVTHSNSQDKIIPGIPELNLSQISHMAALPFLFSFVNAFPGLALNNLFFFFLCQCRNYAPKRIESVMYCTITF